MDYKEKLRLAKEALDSGSYDKETIEYIFPELAESEDESIRKAMINYFTNGKEYLSLTPYSKEDYIAWLEKQGKQSSKNTNKECLKGIKRVQEYQDLSDWEKKFDNIASMYAHNKNQEGYNKSWYVKERAAAMLYYAKKELEKQGEQKSVEWSEEDKKMKDAIYSCVDSHYDGLAKTSLLIWLEALEDRVQPQQGWSEEDKVIRNTLTKFVELLYSYGSGIYDLDKKQFLDWLQKLEGRIVSK